MKLTAQQAADYLGFSVGTIRNMAKDNKLPAEKIGNGKVKSKFQFDQKQLREWKQQQLEPKPRKVTKASISIPEGFVDANEAEKISGFRSTSLYAYVHAGKLERIKQGGRAYFRASELPTTKKRVQQIPIGTFVEPAITPSKPSEFRAQLDRIENMLASLIKIWS